MAEVPMKLNKSTVTTWNKNCHPSQGRLLDFTKEDKIKDIKKILSICTVSRLQMEKKLILLTQSGYDPKAM